MRKLLSILVLLAGVLAAAGCFHTRKLRVMSMFVPSTDQSNQPLCWNDQKPQLVRLMSHANPDIIGFQNASKVQIYSLLIEMPEYGSVGEKGFTIDGKPVFNPVFYKKDQFELIARSQFNINDNASLTRGALSPLWVTWLKLRYRHTGHIFYLFNASLGDEAEHDHPKDALRFLSEIKMIAGNAPVVITGCLHQPGDRDDYNIITANYHDAFPFWDAATFHVKTTPALHDPLGNLIFVNGYYNVVKYELLTAPRDGVQVYNHWAVMAQLEFADHQRTKPGDATRLNNDEGAVSVKARLLAP